MREIINIFVIYCFDTHIQYMRLMKKKILHVNHKYVSEKTNACHLSWY